MFDSRGPEQVPNTKLEEHPLRRDVRGHRGHTRKRRACSVPLGSHLTDVHGSKHRVSAGPQKWRPFSTKQFRHRTRRSFRDPRAAEMYKFLHHFAHPNRCRSSSFSPLCGIVDRAILPQESDCFFGRDPLPTNIPTRKRWMTLKALTDLFNCPREHRREADGQ